MQIAVTAINAALYAAVGIMTFFGVFAPPPVGVVRFWPVVIIPGVFATLFGPWVGGIGAAFGILASDMVVHGNFLLSVTVGVPSNFLGFFVLGYIARKDISPRKLWVVLGLGALIIIGGILSIVAIPDTFTFTGLSTTESVLLFLAAVGGSYALMVFAVFALRKWRSYVVASVLGLGLGSLIIGLGLVAFFNSPFYFSLLWFIWTFTTEIPFLLVLGPPILKACYLAFPSLKPQES